MAYAEKARYWQTPVSPMKSQGEILALLDEFGADRMQVTTGRADGRLAWLIRFDWQGRSYRFVFQPLPCEYPDKVLSHDGKRRPNHAQAEYQMGRIAYGFVKALLTAAEAQPTVLFGFLELPAMRRHPSGFPYTAAELDVEDLTGLLPAPNVLQIEGG